MLATEGYCKPASKDYDVMDLEPWGETSFLFCGSLTREMGPTVHQGHRNEDSRRRGVAISVHTTRRSLDARLAL